jgi:hypothetical protein
MEAAVEENLAISSQLSAVSKTQRVGGGDGEFGLAES